jgi:thioredoxin-like negative regulator of GroEL
MVTRPKPSIRAIIQTLEKKPLEANPARSKRIMAACILELGREAEAAVPVLGKLARNPKDPAWEIAVGLLAHLGVPCEEAIPGLLAALRNKSYSLRRDAAKALVGHMGTHATPAILRSPGR